MARDIREEDGAKRLRDLKLCGLAVLVMAVFAMVQLIARRAVAAATELRLDVQIGCEVDNAGSRNGHRDDR